LIIDKHDLLSQVQSEEANDETNKEKNQTGLYILDCLHQVFFFQKFFFKNK